MSTRPNAIVRLEEQLSVLTTHLEDLKALRLEEIPDPRKGPVDLKRFQRENRGYNALVVYGNHQHACMATLEQALEDAMRAFDPRRAEVGADFLEQVMKRAQDPGPFRPEKDLLHAVTANDAIRAGLITTEEATVLTNAKPWMAHSTKLPETVAVLERDLQILHSVSVRLRNAMERRTRDVSPA